MSQICLIHAVTRSTAHRSSLIDSLISLTVCVKQLTVREQSLETCCMNTGAGAEGASVPVIAAASAICGCFP